MDLHLSYFAGLTGGENAWAFKKKNIFGIIEINEKIQMIRSGKEKIKKNPQPHYFNEPFYTWSHFL